jgi:hypothetical protein
MGPEASVESELEDDSSMSFQMESRDIQVSKELMESMLIFDDRSELTESESESESNSSELDLSDDSESDELSSISMFTSSRY